MEKLKDTTIFFIVCLTGVILLVVGVFFIINSKLETVKICDTATIIEKRFQPATGECIGLNKCRRHSQQDWYFVYFTDTSYKFEAQKLYNIGDKIEYCYNKIKEN